MPNMPQAPWELVLGEAEQRQQWKDWVNQNSEYIRTLYYRVGQYKPPPAYIERIARGQSAYVDELKRFELYDQYREIYRSYFKGGPTQGEPTQNPGFKNLGWGVREGMIARFYDPIADTYKSPEEFGRYIEARKNTDKLDSDAVKAYGYDNLVKAYQGLKDYMPVLQDALYFQNIKPIMKQYLNRGVTAQDVANLQKRFKPEQYEQYLLAGKEATTIAADINTQDIGRFMQLAPGGEQTPSVEPSLRVRPERGRHGPPLPPYYGRKPAPVAPTPVAPTPVGAPNANQIQEMIYGGQGQDLQRRIEEARVIRKNAYTAAKSKVATELTPGGGIIEKLF